MKTLLLVALALVSSAHAARFVVEADTPPVIKGAKVEAFYPTKHKYFSHLFIVSGNISAKEISKHKGVRMVEESIEITKLSLIPIDNSRQLVRDELFAYQWGLLNQGQTYLREQDDIRNLPLRGVLGKDIGFEALLNKLPSTRPIVAVLDSGVDINHPELKNNLWKNEAECGKDPKVDNDGNKLAGDCSGWNFTEVIDSDAAKDPRDNDGHGTHVAGIIGAANDGDGIVGVLPGALIMPIKVMKDSGSTSEIPSSESFARGIIYAVDNGAKVINMSLGWPRSLETRYLREAVYYALGQGVAIVAAAGNNNSTEPLFPCAYEGVICVAASTIDGNLASFSNFGGHVDTIAPGEEILSAHPTQFEPDYFSVPGYEMRSGTSQAAPMVAGLVAALYAEEPGLKIDELLARFYSLEKSKDQKKYVLGGEATYAGLSRKVEIPVVRPILKRIRQIVVRGNDSRLVVPLRNFGVTSGEVEVSVEGLSSALTIKTQAQTVSAMAQGESKDLAFEISVNDFNMESNVTIKVTLKEGDKVHSYLNQIPVVRNISEEAGFTKVPFKFTDRALPVGSVRNGAVVSNLTTLTSFANTPKHEMYLRRIIREGEKKSLEIALFSRHENKFVEAPKVILIENATSLVNFIRIDLNQDGVEDYFVQVVAEKDGKKFFQFSFYNSNMDALFPTFQHIGLEIDTYVQNMNEMGFIGFTHPTLGKMMVPAFFTEGVLPRVDQVITTWERLDTNRKKRLFYLEVTNDLRLKIRALTTKVWEDALKRELNSRWMETVEIEQVLPVTDEDTRSGQLRALVSVGQSTRRKLYIFAFTTKSSRHGGALPQLVLQTEEIDPLLSVTNEGLKTVGDVYFNVYDRERSKIVTTKDLSQESEYVYRHRTETDIIAGHLATFEMSGKKISVLQSREELISITRGQTEKISKRPKLRYSFLSQKLLSEMYLPVIFERRGTLAPALYVDSTAVTANRISLYEEQDGTLVSSIKNSVAVPVNCRAMNPAKAAASGAHEFVFLCQENTEWSIRTYKMN
jgi:cell wall-associated protease